MEKFDIFRYIRTWRHIIAIFCIVMMVFVYYYIGSNQTYTASVVISYTNADAKTKGLTRYGDTINSDEITSTIVIADVIEQLGLYCTVDDIRSNVSVDPIIDEDEELKKQAKLDDGEDYVYYNTDYSISYTVGNNYSRKYAQNVLNQLVKSYVSYFGEKYLNTSITGISLTDISTDRHDYLDCVELVDRTVNTLSDYVDDRINVDSTFRSSKTGYAFSDFSESLDYIAEFTVPKLYSMVTNNNMTDDYRVLTNRLQNDLSKYKKQAQNLKENIADIKSLMKKYEDKYENSTYWSAQNSDGTDTADGDDTSGGKIIIGDVEENNQSNSDATTTYDALVTKLVDLQISYKQTNESIKYSQDMYNIFSKVKSDTPDSAKVIATFEELIADTTEDLTELYNTLNVSLDEYNQKVGSTDLKALNSSVSYSKINVRLYMIMAFVLFGIVGICGSILFGRLADFIRYFLYIDKKSGLPNRIRCDAVIDSYEEGLPATNFSCVVIKVKNLQNINSKKGYPVGDTILSEFGKILKPFSEKYGFIGYNNGDSFIAMFENCSALRAMTFIEHLRTACAVFAEENDRDETQFYYGISTTGTDKVYDIHKLLSLSYKKVAAEVDEDIRKENEGENSKQSTDDDTTSYDFSDENEGSTDTNETEIKE